MMSILRCWQGKSEAHRRIEAPRDHGYAELHLDFACIGRETEDRASPILVGRLSEDRWLITHPVPCKGTQHRWIVACERRDLERRASPGGEIRPGGVYVKNSLMRVLRGVDGPTVMPEESPVGASAANAVIERSVWEMQSTTRATVAYAEWVHETMFEISSAIFGKGCGVLRTGFRMGRQHMNAGSRKATTKRLFRSVNW